MEWLIEIVFEIFGEFILQMIFEAIAQAGLHVFKKPGRKDYDPVLLFVGYALFGALAGWLSLLFFPDYMLRDYASRVAYLLLAPAIVGACIAAIGARRSKRGEVRIGIDRFIYGYVFAFTFALIRFFFATTA